MNKTYRKNMWRELAANKSRFASVFGIVLLGVMMLSGLLSVGPGMRRAGQRWYSGQNVFDIRVVSTLGLSGADIDAIAAVEGVEAVMPVKSVDCEGSYRGGSTLAVRLQQLPVYPQLADKANMNRLVLVSGRLPETPDECAVQVLDSAADNIRLGDVITLSGYTEGDLAEGEVTVVGFVTDPLYFSNETESTTAGNGALGLAVYLPDGSLTMDYYASCYIKAAGAGQYDNYSDEYQAAVDAVKTRLEGIAAGQAAQRRDELIQSARDQLDEARAEFERQEADARAQLADAEAQLNEAKAELDEGEAAYASGKAQLEEQKAALPGAMASGADQLVDAQRQVLEFEAQLEQIKQLVTLKGVADPMLGYAEDILHNAEQALEEAEPDDVNYVELRDILNRAQALYDSTYDQLQSYQAQLDEGKRQMYAQGLISSPDLTNEELVTEAEAALREMKLQVLSGQLALNTGNAEAFTAFDAAEQQLEAARAQLDDGWAQYNEGAAEFARQKADAEAQLADARRQLADAEEQVDDITAGEWYVLDRGSVVSMVLFEQNADRIESIARVFPVFFFLVAALVASTTMTRMVEEHGLRHLGRAAGLHRRHGAGVLPHPVDHLVGLFHRLCAAHLPAGGLPRPRGDERGHQHRGGGADHFGGLPGLPAGEAGRPAAAPRPRRRQADLPRAGGPAVAADELFPKDHRPQYVPLQKALLHDGAGRGGLYRAAVDRLRAAGLHRRDRRPAVRQRAAGRPGHLAVQR